MTTTTTISLLIITEKAVRRHIRLTKAQPTPDNILRLIEAVNNMLDRLQAPKAHNVTNDDIRHGIEVVREAMALVDIVNADNRRRHAARAAA